MKASFIMFKLSIFLIILTPFQLQAQNSITLAIKKSSKLILPPVCRKVL
ncbi:MAG: hypothetical protein JWP78_6 [Mucilaginibacter sp.]|nr:hypothetical protein [Mucilaginibacter sp.]